MTTETISDAVGVFATLYRGKDPHVTIKLAWWCQQLGQDRPLAAITPDDIDEGLRVLIETPANTYRRGEGVVHARKQRANGTINKYVAALGSMYKLLKLHRRLPRSFASPIVKGLMLPLPQGRTLQVSIGDVQKLVHAARLSSNRKLAALVAVACTTGLRKSNIQQITWGDVDLKARTIDVRTTKNGTSTRSVLPAWAASELARIRPDSPAPDMPVFDRREFKKAWAATLDRAGIPGSEGWTFHHCRHIAASILAQSGASLPLIMQALNHKTPGMALRYSHVNTAALVTAITHAWG